MTLTLRRALGYIIDSMMVWIPLSIIAIVFFITRTIISWIPVLNWFTFLFSLSWISFTIFFIYDFISMLVFNTTVGKTAMLIKVVNDQGYPLDFGQKLLRSILRSLQFTFVGQAFLFINLGIIVLRGEQFSIHDLLVGSQVWRK
ncbi:MAG: RDD family protein [Erysipelothrix sp.]|jgi:uncharacterized RDD family membrane protein YckC|nr:RDD family protein [Erysipelothrix sp.]